MAFEGGCYCGAVRYHAEGEAVFKGQCHCRECQYIAGGGPNLIMGVPDATFEYVKGTPKTFERSDLDKPVKREFCELCGTHLVSRSPGVPLALIKVGTLDDPAEFGAAQMAFYTVDQQSFHTLPEGCAHFERLPG